jgi:hypothetical protein
VPDVTYLDNVQAHLIAQGVVRDPRVAGSDPPIWRQPREGAPAPDEKTGVENDAAAVLSIFHTGGIPGGEESGSIETVVFDLWLRTKKWPRARVLYQQIYPVFVANSGPRRDWNMAGLQVVESRLWRALQPVSSNKQAYTFTSGWMLQLYTGSP